MQEITITEALAEIKLIEKKIESKTALVTANLTRVKHIPDPLGDSVATLSQEMQAIGDLYERLVRIRSAIAMANITNVITCDESTRTIYDWLVWKREVADKHISLYTTVFKNTKSMMDTAAQRPQVFKDEKTQEPKLVELVANLSYMDYVKKAEEKQATLDKLDGLLSLKNATITIKI
jgi:hypothetical protein